MSDEIIYDRRRFLGAAAMTVAAARFRLVESTSTQSGTAKPVGPLPIQPSFGPVKQINAGLLNVGYVDAGPQTGQAVVLLHGWPYDIHSYADVAPLLASAGYRVIVPYLRGYGTTRFLSDATFRKRATVRDGRRHRGAHGRAENREGGSSAASIGARERATSSPRSGRTAAKRSYQSAGI